MFCFGLLSCHNSKNSCEQTELQGTLQVVDLLIPTRSVQVDVDSPILHSCDQISRDPLTWIARRILELADNEAAAVQAVDMHETTKFVVKMRDIEVLGEGFDGWVFVAIMVCIVVIVAIKTWGPDRNDHTKTNSTTSDNSAQASRPEASDHDACHEQPQGNPL